MEWVEPSQNKSYVQHTAYRVTHALWLVSGGVFAGLAYEYAGRPWDTARKLLYQHEITVEPSKQMSSLLILSDKAKADGLLSFFRRAPPVDSTGSNSSHRPSRLGTALRTLARVGPWGIGFLVWEALGPGLVV